MRKFNYLSLLLIAMSFGFISCDDDATPQVMPEEPKAITVTAEGFPFGDGYQQSLSDIDFSSSTAPVGGENMTWDYSNLMVTSKAATVPYKSYSDPAFSGANLSQTATTEYSLTNEKRDVIYVYSSTADGYYEHGRKYEADFVIPVFGGAGSVTYIAEDVIYSPKIKAVIFPFDYEDKAESEHVETSNFKATLPSAGLNNTPGANTDSISYSAEAIGWGQLKLPAYSESIEVLLIKRVEVRRDYWFLGGAPAPASLLTNLGIVDGAKTTIVTYVFYTKNQGPALFVNYEDDKLGGVYFVNDLSV